MASAPSLDDILTCPICQERYTDPQLLLCQHTLCKRCVDNMFQFNHTRQNIICPICRQPSYRHEIKVDFKMNTFLLSTENDSLIDGKICDLCQKQKVTKECTDCERLLCEICATAHKAIPSCKEHHVKSLEDIVSKKRSKLFKIRKEVEYEKSILEQKYGFLTTCENDINMVCTKLTEEANVWHTNIIRKINDHHKRIVEQIQQIQHNETEDIRKIKHELLNSQEIINLTLKQHQQLENESDDAKFLGDTDELLKKDSNMELRKATECIPTKAKQSFPLLSLNYGQQWNEKYGLKLKIEKRQNFNPLSFIKSRINPEVTFPRNTLSGKLKIKHHLKVDHFTKKIRFHEGNIWCLYEGHLDIYTAHGTWLRSVTDNISHANGMSSMQNIIIIATMGSGLLCYKQSGSLEAILGDGVFCDVTTDDKNTVYTLDYNNNKSKITKYVKDFFGRWDKTQDIKLPQDNLNPFNTIIWNGSSILVTAIMPDTTLMYRIEPNGIILQIHEWQRTILRLCCADTNGDVLMTDPVNNKLSVFHSVQKEKIDLNGNCDCAHDKPYSVTVDTENGIWVSNNTKNIVCYDLY